MNTGHLGTWMHELQGGPFAVPTLGHSDDNGNEWSMAPAIGSGD